MGGTPQRYAALLDGVLPNGTAVYATILTYPFTVEGEALPSGQAPNILARISDYVEPITSSAFTIRESSLSSPSKVKLLTKFMTSMYGASQFLLNPLLKDCSIRAIAAQLNVTEAVAATEYASATNPVSGEVSPGHNFTVSQKGILTDARIRRKFGGFTGEPANFNFAAALEPGPGKLIQYSVRDAAVEAYRKHPLTGKCKSSCS